MIRHIVIAAWRNMVANRLLSAITILGLVIGVMAVLLTTSLILGVYQENEFLTDYQRTFIVAMPRLDHGYYSTSIAPGIAPLLKANIPDIENAARASIQNGQLRNGNVTAQEPIAWADPSYFAVLRYPMFQGDAQAALSHPDGVVVTRALARKYFGRDAVLGQTILLDGAPMTIRAVLQDPPRTAGYQDAYFYASALSARSSLRSRTGFPLDSSMGNTLSYLRLKEEGSTEAVQRRAHALLAPAFARLTAEERAAHNDAPLLVRIDRMGPSEQLKPGIHAKFVMILAVGILLLFIASANFVNLMTARATRRSKEVGIRKVCGAGRSSLVFQFLGESVLTVFLATLLALSITEWLISNVAFFGTFAPLDYWRDPTLLMALLLGVVLVGITAGAWPALVLSSFRPASVIRGVMAGGGRAGLIRNGLVTLQFAILIFFTATAILMYQQYLFVLRAPLGLDIEGMVTIETDCSPSFLSELRRQPGVAGVACTSHDFVNPSTPDSVAYQGKTERLDIVHADWNAFALYGIRPLAGSLPGVASDQARDVPGLVVNQAAVRRLGIASNQAALGRMVTDTGELSGRPIVAVVPDFSTFSWVRPVDPAVFVPVVLSKDGELVNVKLANRPIPETLSAIDTLWAKTGHTGATRRAFASLEKGVVFTYIALSFGGCALLAVFLACMGLTGLSVAIAEHRIKEIGIRKAMGAGDGTIVAMLMVQFAKPVLWASLLGWPVAAWTAHILLANYARHISLQPWAFLAASLIALILGLTTVASHAIWAARQKPVLALRYE